MASKIAYLSVNGVVGCSSPIVRQLHGNDCRGGTVLKDKYGYGIHAYKWDTGDKSVLVAFKGSSAGGDFLRSIDVRMEEFKFRDKVVGIHKGYFDMFHSIENDLTHMFMEEKPKSITFCGHSLGGALALIAGAYYGAMFAGNKNILVHTFGAPMVGDGAMIEWVNEVAGGGEGSEVVCLKNKGDVVCGFPWFWLWGWYIDTGNVLSLGGDNNLLNFLHNHDLDTYIANIGNESMRHLPPPT